MSTFDYFLAPTKPDYGVLPPQLRRFLKGCETGERFSFEAGKWSGECCRRRACELTRDRLIDEAEAFMLCA